ncbi:MAG TPA: hemolysin III family protein [Longimicrobiaceae bacterium]|nr:hemolysin III family protein [Longimicrobiaceae bacterium]
MDEVIDVREEVASALTHGLGVVASAAGGAVLVTLAALYGDAWQVVGASVFCGSLVLLYTASTLYHAVRHRIARARLQVFDHCAIYVLIAGTYTPFTLGVLRGAWGWSLFGVVWGLAAAGVVFKLFCTGRFRRLSTFIYLAMGWLVVVATGPMLRALEPSTVLWLVAGGLTYTAGTYFYLNRRIRYSHAIWHLFVLGGSVCHFVAVLSQVLPPSGS